MTHPLLELPAAFHRGWPVGITSVCSAHPVVIEAALRRALETGRLALIEATCNQVNQDGGYTGMTPARFRDFVQDISARVGLPFDRIVLGGDHLGPNPWRHLPAAEAMAKAETMVAAFAAAGFSKLHLDCSMGCAGEPAALDDRTIASRAARLASAAEANRTGPHAPVYVIGTEVPVPGGAVEALDHLEVTTPEAVAETYAIHRDAFAARDLDEAFARVIAMVVQPGVEFGQSDVVRFVPERARHLTDILTRWPNLVFEAHSTDYQAEADLAALVRGGFAILKVGPQLTFALRQALYGLDAIADVLDGGVPLGGLMAAMDRIMEADPANWARYYEGTETQRFVQRHFSYSDRIRYYWASPAASAAVEALLARFDGRIIPAPLQLQFLGRDRGDVSATDVLIAAVEDVLDLYDRSCQPG